MIILFHVIIALGSIVATSIAAFFPSRSKLYIGGALVAVTLATGTYLVIRLHSPLVQTCISGLAYLAVTLASMTIAQYRLATAKQSR